ncbi:MAG: Uma2 family endonuclease, partial [Prochlorothrix sp.]|nr:Uma2 family endonuclease [Prochlorothrix sp.]
MTANLTHPKLAHPDRWTIADLDHLNPDRHYEIIAGDLHMIHAPHWRHQEVCDNVAEVLRVWSRGTGLGRVATGPGVIFSEADNVIPDVVWVQRERLGAIVDEAGHLTAAPDLVV